MTEPASLAPDSMPVTYLKIKDGSLYLPAGQKAKVLTAYEKLAELPQGDIRKAAEDALASTVYSASRNDSLRKEASELREDIAALAASKGIAMPEFLKFKDMQAMYLRTFFSQMQKVSDLNKKEGLPDCRLFWLEHEFCVLRDGLNYWAKKFIEDINAKPVIPENSVPEKP